MWTRRQRGALDLRATRVELGARGALDGSDGLARLKSAVAAEPRLIMDVMSEQDYFSGQTRQFRKTIGFLAGVVTLIMGLGAVFAALNSMYAAVAARGKEIATLRAIGFGGSSVVVSVMIEALLLALSGGVLGALIAYLLFNGLSVSTSDRTLPGGVQLQGDAGAGRARADHRRDHRHDRRLPAGATRGAAAGGHEPARGVSANG